MKDATTTRLSLSFTDRARLAWSLYERTFRDICLGASFVVALLLIHSLLKPAEAPMRPIVRATVAPIILIRKEAAPTLPPLPTYTPAPTVQPEVVYVEAPAQVIYVQVQAPVEAPPTPAPEVLTERQQNIQEHYVEPRPPEAPQQGGGGSGKMAAPAIGPLTNSSWCAAAAAAGHATCVDQP